MKANELRIGNIIKDDRKAKAWRVVTHRIISDLASNPNIELYHAIPLTEEWLLKFGFKEREDDADAGRFIIELPSYTTTGSEICVQIETDDEYASTEIFIKEGEGFASRWLHLKNICIYVHQLQNLYFALTGKELTIKE